MTASGELFVMECAEKEGHFNFYPESASLWEKIKGSEMFSLLCKEILERSHHLNESLKRETEIIRQIHCPICQYPKQYTKTYQPI